MQAFIAGIIWLIVILNLSYLWFHIKRIRIPHGILRPGYSNKEMVVALALSGSGYLITGFYLGAQL